MSRPDLLPHEADALLRSVHAPLFPTTVHPSAEEIDRHHRLQQQHLRHMHRLYGQVDGFDAPEDEDHSPFTFLASALRFIVVAALAVGCAAIGIAASIWAGGAHL